MSLSEARRGSAVFTTMLADPDPPREVPRRGFNDLKTRILACQQPAASARRTFTIFYGRVRTIHVHARF